MKRWLLGCAGVLATLLGTCAAWAQTAPEASCPPQAQAPTPQAMQQSLARAADRGFLWRITRDGRTSHLYGTIHVGKLDWAFPGAKVRAALDASQTLALEIDPLDPAAQADLRRHEGHKPALPAALAERLARLRDRACLPAQALAAMHPILQAMTVMLVDAARDDLHIAYGLEYALAGFARQRSMPVVSLETAQRQLDALIPKDTAQAERALASTLDQIGDGSARRVLKRMAEAWERGDLATIESYEQWCDCIRNDDDRAALRALNDARNPALADKIAALHADGKRLFAAVGALHMTGAQALPALMAARGFRVERVEFR
jgi:uncharacterized protein YbaP (TraB family)